MKSTLAAFSIATAVLALVAGSAMAAPGPSLPLVGSPTSIAAGVYVPTGGNAQRNGGDEQLAVEFTYTVPVPNPLDVPARTLINLGVMTGADNGGHSTVIPLTAEEVFGLNGASPFAPGQFYAGAGAGVYLLNQSGISSAIRYGALVDLGYNITNGLFVDAKYHFVDHANGLVGLVGLRF